MLKYENVFLFNQRKTVEFGTHYLLILVVFASISASHLLLPIITGGWTGYQTKTSDWLSQMSITVSSCSLLLANIIHTRSQKVQFRQGDQTGRVTYIIGLF